MAEHAEHAEQAQQAAGAAPAFGGKRLLYVATGGIGAMFLPMWLHWLRNAYPGLELRYALTPSARQFVGSTAVAVAGGHGHAIADEWPQDPDSALHVELAEWPDTVLVHPSTFHFTARLSLGLADTPVLLALQCTSAPIAVAPALPPGGESSPAYLRHVQELSERPNVVVVPPQPGFSMTTGKPGTAAAATVPEVVVALEKLRSSRAESDEGEAV